MAAYSAAVLERVRNPQRVGALPEAADVGTGEAGSLDVGTFARIQVRVRHERIVEARFTVFGCSAAIAATGLVTEWLEGARVADAGLMTAERVVRHLELPEDRAHVATLAVDAAARAVRDAREKTGRAS
jgi:NifU-like protein involved in Fe-S cluster formation